MTTAYQVGTVYSFDVYPFTQLGNNYQGVAVLSIMDGETANSFFDIVAAHKQLYPQFGPQTGASNDPFSYTYLKLKMPDGSKQYVAIPWINDATVTTSTNGVLTVKIGNVAASDQADVRNALLQNGYQNLTFTFSAG